MNDLTELEDILAHRFADRGLLEQALRHPSYSAEQPKEGANNQRMEFLGDAVLQLALSSFLFNGFPELDEGVLTRLRTTVVRTEALAAYAASIGLGDYMRLGRGEERHGGRERESNLADCFEAVLAALYLDGGLAAAEAPCRQLTDFVIRDNPDELLARENPKGALQEFVALRKDPPPEYVVEGVTGPEHDPRFQVLVRVGDRVLGRAISGSRKDAEKACAQAALQHLGLIHESPGPTGE